MRGILLAGGLNTRLRPATLAAPKSLLPVWDAPLIYHPLCALMDAGAREIMVICAPQWLAAHRRLLGNGAAWGVKLVYAAQRRPRGIPDAYRIAEKFLRGQSSALALADNLFLDGPAGFAAAAQRAANRDNGRWRGATIFVKQVDDPRRFGVATLEKNGRVVELAEKPERPRSPWAATGLYLCDGGAPALARQLLPSARGELEITDLLRDYLERGQLRAARLKKTTAWFDAGTPEDLARAARYVGDRATNSPRGRGASVVFGSPELTALRLGWISPAKFQTALTALGDCDYARRVVRAGELFLRRSLSDKILTDRKSG